MLQQVSEKLLSQFVDSLEAELAAPGPETATGPELPAGPARLAGTAGAETAPIDLLELAGADRLKKYAAVALAVTAVLVLLWVLRRRR